MANAFTGQIVNGVVVFDEGTPAIPGGTRVRVEVIPTEPETVEPVVEHSMVETRRRLLNWARRAESLAPPLPVDLAEEHDFYAHGKPRT